MQADLAAADARCTVDQDGRPRHRPRERRHRRGWGAHRPRSIFHRPTTRPPPPPPPPPPPMAGYASECATVGPEMLGRISTLAPPVERPSRRAAPATQITPRSCRRVAPG